jgi:hypothetical protein
MKAVKNLKIEPGKTYLTRDGQRITIEAKTKHGRTYRMQGEDERGRITWRSTVGRFGRTPSRLDLIAEVEKGE